MNINIRKPQLPSLKPGDMISMSGMWQLLAASCSEGTDVEGEKEERERNCVKSCP